MLWTVAATGYQIALVMLGALAALLALLLVRLYRRVGRLRRAVERITEGHADHRLPQFITGQLGGLSRALNAMAGEFNQRLRSLRQQRNELEAVLGSMIEGVLAVDLDERVISLNRAAAELLKTTPRRAMGRSIQEVIRNTAMQQFVGQALAAETPTQADLVLRTGPEDREEASERFLQVQAAPLHDASGHLIGALIVLHDVTRLRRLEVMRREFVANVSHEIKTPITAIKGSVETLLESGETDPQQVSRFLQIIGRQADRLHAIVEDLLSLARIEQDAERDRVAVEPGRPAEVIDSAIEAVQLQADARQIEIRRTSDDQVEGIFNAPLLEQALVNLLDNAIKYNPAGTTVQVAAQTHGDELVIAVADDGVGIEPEHLPRLFERFYRRDKARSRAQGGTGLGLAIVKHIAQAHQGRVSVDSRPGHGSTFRLHLPRR